MVKVLVTGGAGFIGSNIVEELLKRGETVRVIEGFSTGRSSNLESIGRTALAPALTSASKSEATSTSV